jgi:hypothetical protein
LASTSGRTTKADDGVTLAARLRREISGDVLFDRFSRGRYATDASFYQSLARNGYCAG